MWGYMTTRLAPCQQAIMNRLDIHAHARTQHMHIHHQDPTLPAGHAQYIKHIFIHTRKHWLTFVSMIRLPPRQRAMMQGPSNIIRTNDKNKMQMQPPQDDSWVRKYMCIKLCPAYEISMHFYTCLARPRCSALRTRTRHVYMCAKLYAPV